MPEGKLMRVRAYTSGDEAEFVLNGKPLATNALRESDRMFTTFDVPYEPWSLTVVARKA